MTTNYHTPHAENTPLDSDQFNGVYATLDAAITRVTGLITDPITHGAVGNGIADDTVALQTAITLAGPGGVVSLPAGTYLITDVLTITEDDVTLCALGGATIVQATTDTGAILVTGHNATIAGLTLEGPQYATTVTGEYGINFLGADKDNPVFRGVVSHCYIKNWGMYGVHAEFARDLNVSDNKIEDINYAGVMYRSVVRGQVSRNTIRNIIDTPNSYGITLTRTSGALATYPLTTDITVEGNTIMDVVNWEGIDTHGGQRLTIQGNTIEGCLTGVAVVPAEDGSFTATFAPQEVAIIGNSIDSGSSNGDKGSGITFLGAVIVTGSPVELGTGSIVGNVIRRHGNDTASAGDASGIVITATRGMTVTGNTIIEPSPMGINIYHDNEGYVVADNSIIDAWTNHVSNTIVCPVAVRSTYNRGLIAGNVLGRGSKSATLVNNMGVRLASDDTNSVHNFGINYFALATTPLSVAGGIGAQMRLHASRLGFYSTTPIAKPTVTGSRGGNAALASALTALANLGLITDSSS